MLLIYRNLHVDAGWEMAPLVTPLGHVDPRRLRVFNRGPASVARNAGRRHAQMTLDDLPGSSPRDFRHGTLATLRMLCARGAAGARGDEAARAHAGSGETRGLTAEASGSESDSDGDDTRGLAVRTRL